MKKYEAEIKLFVHTLNESELNGGTISFCDKNRGKS